MRLRNVPVTRRGGLVGGPPRNLSPAEIGLSPELFRALDTDGDGKLSPEELAAFKNQKPDVEAVLELEPAAGQSARVQVLAYPAAGKRRGRPVPRPA